MLADGSGLYLQVKHGNARSWIFRYFRNGKSHEMGLGSLKAVSLGAARLKAAEARRRDRSHRRTRCCAIAAGC